MKNQNYTTSFTVDQSPKEVFDAINNVRGWWSEEIEGRTDRPDAEWTYRYKDVHHCKMKIIEFIPGQKVAWLVVDNLFNFTKDKTEWKGTKVIFEISKKGNKTEVRFTHQGLVPQYECFDVCSDAWGSYIKGSLRNLIVKGKGQPNPLEKVVAKAREMSSQDYTTSFTVSQTPKETFDAINNVRGWWSGEVEGNTDELGAEFTYHVPDAHRSKQKITESSPAKRSSGTCWTPALTLSKTSVSGRAPTLFSRLVKRAAKPRCASRTLGWHRPVSVTTAAQTGGACSSTAICAN